MMAGTAVDGRPAYTSAATVGNAYSSMGVRLTLQVHGFLPLGIATTLIENSASSMSYRKALSLMPWPPERGKVPLRMRAA